MNDIVFVVGQYILVIVASFLIVLGLIYFVKYINPIIKATNLKRELNVYDLKCQREDKKEKLLVKKIKNEELKFNLKEKRKKDKCTKA